MIRLKTFLLSLFMLGIAVTSAAAYTDVPAGHWAETQIELASARGIMQGVSQTQFGLGETVTRAQFAAMINRLMHRDKITPAAPSFSDVSRSAWYYSDVETALANGVLENSKTFSPDASITRQDMAVMLVRALGYQSLADASLTLPFTDVADHRGEIAVAYDLGMVSGVSTDKFSPAAFATREQGAAMMMRLYDRFYGKTASLHGFYAISAWSQRELGAKMDSISYGWSSLTYQNDTVFLNTTNANGNTWCIPAGATDAVNYFSGIPQSLAVQLTDQAAAKAILTAPDKRVEAAKQIAAAAAAYDGVTIDFEGMKGTELKAGLTAFLQALRKEIGDKTLSVCVHPVLKKSPSYFDAYDYRAIGETADQVILMAHDYGATSMSDSLRAAGYTTTPVSPFEEVYYALRCITDPNTGVADKSKITLALSLTNTVGWTLDESGRVVNSTPFHPSAQTIAKRLAQPDTTINYSPQYRNPCATYYTEDGAKNVLWYEDARSIEDKITLARMFGINHLSVWRLGEISTESARDLWTALNKDR